MRMYSARPLPDNAKNQIHFDRLIYKWKSTTIEWSGGVVDVTRGRENDIKNHSFQCTAMLLSFVYEC